MQDELKIFISYSHKDAGLKDRFEGHLNALKRVKKFKSWSDTQINAGEEWHEKIMGELRTSQIIILLVSSDFISSAFCYEKEMEAAMEMYRSGQAIVIPVLLRSCNCKGHPFYSLQMVPSGRAVDDGNTDTAFAHVIEHIEASVDRLITERNTRDIKKRKEELLDLITRGLLADSFTKLLPFAREFSSEAYVRKATSLAATGNFLFLNQKDNVDQIDNLINRILMLIDEITLPQAA